MTESRNPSDQLHAEVSQVPPPILNHFEVVAAALRGGESGTAEKEALLALAAIAQYIGEQGDAIDQLRTENENLAQTATTDPLTGLDNRRALDQRDAEDHRHKRHADHAEEGEQRQSGAAGRWIGTIDLDKFKPINDTLGHPQGDRTLQLFSYAMRLSTRPGDELYRFGGDEFVIIVDFARPVDKKFYNQMARRLHASVAFLLTDEGAGYLERNGFGELTVLDRLVMTDLMDWTVGGYYTEDATKSRTDMIAAADKHLIEQKKAKGNSR